jgi:hypothetical protein
MTHPLLHLVLKLGALWSLSRELSSKLHPNIEQRGDENEGVDTIYL